MDKPSCLASVCVAVALACIAESSQHCGVKTEFVAQFG
jgi:hypothetical protein